LHFWVYIAVVDKPLHESLVGISSSVENPACELGNFQMDQTVPIEAFVALSVV